MFGYKSKKTKEKEEKKKRDDARTLAQANDIIAKDIAATERLSKEPTITLKGLVQNSDGQIKIELDWDSEFIEHLKENGYFGTDDEAIIQKYLLELTSQITESMAGSSDYD